MPRRKIRPEVLRPLILAVAIIIALFVFQFCRPVPPDIRQQQLQKVYETDLQTLHAALQQYQQQYNTLPADWGDLARINFSFESIQTPDRQPDHPTLVQTAEGTKVQNMPFRLLLQGRVDFTGPSQGLVELDGSQDTGTARLYTNGQVQWGRP